MKINELYSDYSEITIESYLNKFGVTDIEEFLHPTGMYIEDPFLYQDMDKAVYMFEKHLIKLNDVYILSDSGDTDGITSTSALYSYMKLLNKKWNIKILIHSGKQRGLQDKELFNQIIFNPRPLVIIPDSGTNDREQAKKLYELGIDLLILDHHQLSTPVEHGVLINNQIGNVDKHGSGAVITHKFLQALDKEFNYNYSGRFIDLIALSIVSDGMFVGSMQNRTYLYYGLFKNRSCIKNKFLDALFQTFIDNDKRPQYIQYDLSFKLIPKINSTCRSEDQCLKQEMIKGFLEMDIDYLELAKTLGEKHKEQIDAVSKFVEDKFNNIDNTNDIIIYADQDVPRSYSGLLAGKIKSMCEEKPTIIGKDFDGVMIGSLRSETPLRKTLDDCEYVDWASGHEKQAGIQIQVDNIPKVIEYINSLNIEYTSAIDVLYHFNVKKIPSRLFGLFDGLETLWDINNMKKPMYYITGMKVKNKDIQIMGDRQNVIKFKSSGVEFVIFDNSRDLKEQLMLRRYIDDEFIDIEEKIMLEINVIGYLTINEWNGRKTNSIQIDKLEVSIAKEKTLEDLL